MPEIKAYHGSRNGHQGFDTSHTGHNSHTFGQYDSHRHGIFFSKNPKFAAMYGDVQEYTLRLRKTLNLDSREIFERVVHGFVESLFELDRNMALDAQNILRGYFPVWKLFEDGIGAAFVKHIRSLGFDSAVFTEYNHDENEREIRSKTYVVFNPANVIKDGQLELNLWEGMRHWMNLCR